MSTVLLRLNVDVHDRQDHYPTMLPMTCNQAGGSARDDDAVNDSGSDRTTITSSPSDRREGANKRAQINIPASASLSRTREEYRGGYKESVQVGAAAAAGVNSPDTAGPAASLMPYRRLMGEYDVGKRLLMANGFRKPLPDARMQR